MKKSERWRWGLNGKKNEETGGGSNGNVVYLAGVWITKMYVYICYYLLIGTVYNLLISTSTKR